MTQQEKEDTIKAFTHAVNTGSFDGIQVLVPSIETWKNKGNKEFDCTRAYRIKPKPTLRPWKMEEVPLDAWFRMKALEKFPMWRPFEVTEIGVAYESVTIKQFRHYETLMDKYEHTTDGGKTWKPCGVEE